MKVLLLFHLHHYENSRLMVPSISNHNVLHPNANIRKYSEIYIIYTEIIIKTAFPTLLKLTA